MTWQHAVLLAFIASAAFTIMLVAVFAFGDHTAEDNW